MKFAKDVTLVVGVDAKYIEQMETTFAHWLVKFPALRDINWSFFYDGQATEVRRRIVTLVERQVHRGEIRYQAWLPDVEYETQRERMLTAWVLLAPYIVKTKFFLKLDVDSFMTKQLPASFPNPRWFEGDPAFIGHKWGYTKRTDSRDWFQHLDQWGDEHFGFSSRLGIRFESGKNKLSHARVASYVAFIETRFARQVAETCSGWKIPIPSQDTFHWYCAERMERRVVRVNFKRQGISNQSKISKLKDVVK